MTTNQDKRGFASMPEEKVKDIASKGGHASAEKAGQEGMAERGSKGGQARSSSSREEDNEDDNDNE